MKEWISPLIATLGIIWFTFMSVVFKYGQEVVLQRDKDYITWKEVISAVLTTVSVLLMVIGALGIILSVLVPFFKRILG